MFRVSLGLVLFSAASALAVLCIYSSLAPIGFWQRGMNGLVGLFFFLQAYGVWRILIFRRAGVRKALGPYWFPPGDNPPADAGVLVPAPPRRGPPTLSAAATAFVRADDAA
jgi:hypothetical protein